MKRRLFPIATVAVFLTFAPISHANDRLSGEYQIQMSASGRFWHANDLQDKLISTRWQPNDDYTRFVFHPQSDGSYRIAVKATGRFLHADETGDKLLSTRWQPNDAYTRFHVKKQADGTYLITVQPTGRHLHCNDRFDKLVSTRWQPNDAYTRFRLVSRRDKNLQIVEAKQWDLGGQTAGVHMVIAPQVSKLSNGNRQVLVSLIGSNVHATNTGSLRSNSNTHRGWFLESVRTSIVAQDPRVKLVGMSQFSATLEGEVTTSLTDSASGSASTDGIAGQIAREWGKEHSENLRGFTPHLTVSGQSRRSRKWYATNEYKLTGVSHYNGGGLVKYSKWQDITNIPQEGSAQFREGFTGFFTGELYDSFKVHQLPPKAISGLPLLSQAVFEVPSGVPVTSIKVSVLPRLRRVWITGKTKADGNARQESKGLSFSRVVPINLDDIVE